MNSRCRIASSVALVLVLVTSCRLYGQTLARWTGESGSWTDASRWDIGVVPNNTGGTTYVVVNSVPNEALRPAPDLGGAISTEYVTGLATVDGKMIILLDVDRLIDIGIMQNVAEAG